MNTQPGPHDFEEETPVFGPGHQPEKPIRPEKPEWVPLRDNKLVEVNTKTGRFRTVDFTQKRN